MNSILTPSRSRLAGYTLTALTLFGSAASLAARDTSYTYFPNGLLHTVDGPRTDVTDLTTYTYTASGYLSTITDAKNLVVTYSGHDARGLPSTMTDVNGINTQLTYTARGWLKTSALMISNGAGGFRPLTTTFAYNDAGLVTKVTLPDGSFTEMEYDAAQRLYAIENNLGERIEYTLDNAGNRTAQTIKASGGSVTFSHTQGYDELSRVISDTGANSQNTSFLYDTNGNEQQRTDALSNATSKAYDALDRVSVLTDANTKTVGFTYDDYDRIKTVTDQRGLVTTYSYNDFGDLTSIDSPDTGLTSFTHDSAGNVNSQTDARGVVTNYTYDELNRVTTITYPSDATKNVTYVYENAGYCNRCNGRIAYIQDSSGIVYFFYDDAGRVTLRHNVVNLPSGGTATLVTNFTHDDASRVSSITYPNGHTISYVRDSVGQITAVNSQAVGTSTPASVVSAVSYQPFGGVNSLTYGNSLQLVKNYNLDGYLDDQTLNGKQDLDYGYDSANNITSITNTVDSTDSQVLTYDALYRLDTATGRYGSRDYDFDDVGNRTKKTSLVNGVTRVEDYTTSTSSNRLDSISIDTGGTQTSRSFLYDSAGNLTDETREDGSHMKPAYDVTNRMESVSP